MRTFRSGLMVLAVIPALVLTGLSPAVASARGSGTTIIGSFPGRGQITVRAGHAQIPFGATARPSLGTQSTAAAAVATADIEVTYNGFSAAAQNAFEAAVSVWETRIVSTQVIHVNATWEGLGSGVLGQAGPNAFYLMDDGFVYPAALAEARCSCEKDASEIDASFNSAFPDWYLGTDGNTPADKWDFYSVVLHELGHGLGFLSSFYVQGSQGGWGFTDEFFHVYPLRFDLNEWSAASGGIALTDTSVYPNPSAALKTELTDGGVFLGGSNVEAALGGRAALYAPNPWSPGSSNSHLDEAAFPNGNENALMTPYLDNGETAHDPGPVTLAVFRDIGWSTSESVPQPPTISSVSPNAGPTAGGQTVIISGTDFNAVNWVSFGATAAASFTVDSAIQITAVSPAHAAGLVHVRVNTAVGTSAATNADLYTYQPATATITSVSPVAGPPGGGQTVTINGANFSGVHWVSFGATAASSFTVNSPTKITAVTPAHAAGLVHVRVNTSLGTSAATNADRYTYESAPTISSVSPSAGPPGGGQSVVINGFNFSSTNWVSFGGTAAPSFTVNSPTKITAVTPAHAGGVVHVRVNTPLGTSAVTNADRYAYEGTPTITSVAPQIGPAAGGQTVIISGTNLFGANWVSFGATAASFTVNSPTQITVVTPAHAAATIHVRVNTPLGTSAATTADLYTFQ